LRTAINLGISEGRLIKNYNFAESNNYTLPQLPVNMHSLPLMEFHPKNTQTPVESEQYNCPSSKLLNVSDWMYSEDFASGIGELSTNLHQDSSEIKNDLLSSLIKHFLHFGFGAEALALLSSNNSVFSEEEKGFLIGIAHIISLGYDPTLAFNNVTNECSGAAQLWSLLSSDEDYDFLSVDKSEVVFAFASLPLQLRQLLGPLLALKLSDNRNSSLAEQILVMTNSKAEKINSSLYGAETLIPDRFSGPPDFSELQPLVAPDPDVIGISTLTETVFRSFELGTPLTRDTADLVGSYYLQFRESPHAENLEHAYILALAQSSQFTEALGYLTNESSSLSQENKHYVLDQTLHALVKLPDDITFASIVLGTPPLTNDPELNFEIADRLLSLGFPERALGSGLIKLDPEPDGCQLDHRQEVA
jgi:hypothetical protein